MYKYSVLTSFYKGSRFIKNFTNNINRQKIVPYQIIIIDDGFNGSDFKKRVLKNLKRKTKVVILKNIYNIGISRSLNKGLKHNQANYLFRLDCDDYWYDNHVKLNLNEIKSNKQIFILANKNKLNFFYNFFFDNYFINYNPTIHSSWVIRINKKDDFKYKFLPGNQSYPEDYLTMLKYIKKNKKISLLKEKTVYHHKSASSHGSINSNRVKYNFTIKSISKELFYFYFKKDFFFPLKFGLFNFMIFFIKNYIVNSKT